jgi:hypothetical protein
VWETRSWYAISMIIMEAFSVLVDEKNDIFMVVIRGPRARWPGRTICFMLFLLSHRRIVSGRGLIRCASACFCCVWSSDDADGRTIPMSIFSFTAQELFTYSPQ